MLPYNKIIDIADFDDPDLLPFLHDIARGEMLRFGLDEPLIIPDSKQWECAMMLRTLTDRGVIRPGAMLAGIGAGTEETSFALAAKGCIVFPADRYLEVTPWSDVAPAGMMVRPEQYSQFAYPRGSVIPVHSDARVLSLPSASFDGVYSAGSIEHFGSLDAVAAAAEEIGRILKPGGTAVLSTEYRVDGPNDGRWFSDDCILFTPDLLETYIIKPSGLELLDQPHFATSPPTYDSRVVLVDFLDRAKRIQTVADKRNAYPNLILFHDGYLFCSVHLALHKPMSSTSSVTPVYASRFTDVVSAQAAKASGILTGQIVDWTERFTNPPQPPRISQEELDQLHDRLNEREKLVGQQVEHLKMLDEMAERQNNMIQHQKISIEYHIDLVQQRDREIEALRTLMQQESERARQERELASQLTVAPTALVRATVRLENGIRRQPALLTGARFAARALRKVRRLIG